MSKYWLIVFLFSYVKPQTFPFYISQTSDSTTCSESLKILSTLDGKSITAVKIPPLNNNIDCVTTITGPENSQFLINFQTVEMDGKYLECLDYVKIGVLDGDQISSGDWIPTKGMNVTFLNVNETSEEICGYPYDRTNLPSPMITATNKINVIIHTDNVSKSAGFSFILTPINGDLSSPAEIECNGQKLEDVFICDNTINCFDQSDELDIIGIGCPIEVLGKSAGLIVLYVLLGILGLILIFIGLLYLRVKIREHLLKQELYKIQTKIIGDEGLTNESDVDLTKYDILDII